MKAMSPNIIRVTVLLFLSMIVAFLCMLVVYWSFPESFLVLIISTLLIFFLLFLVIFRILKVFMINKFKQTYNVLYDSEILKQNSEKPDETTFLSGVDDELSYLASQKDKEIGHLKQLEQYRKEFLGNVSHELKTPIFNIQGYVLTLLEGGIEDNTINKLYLERTERNVNRMISIVEDLEAISRLESGELTLEWESFNLFQLMKEVIESNEIKALEKGVKLSIGSDSEKSIMVYADKRRIFQVINNLIDNSIKYGKEKGQTTVGFIDVMDKILVEISDNGIGIEEKHIPRLFERFYRVDKSRSRDQGGTGLGLSIVKHLIEAHNQTIKVKSCPGAGTSFSFTLQKAK